MQSLTSKVTNLESLARPLTKCNSCLSCKRCRVRLHFHSSLRCGCLSSTCLPLTRQNFACIQIKPGPVARRLGESDTLRGILHNDAPLLQNNGSLFQTHKHDGESPCPGRQTVKAKSVVFVKVEPAFPTRLDRTQTAPISRQMSRAPGLAASPAKDARSLPIPNKCPPLQSSKSISGIARVPAVTGKEQEPKGKKIPGSAPPPALELCR